MCTVRCLNTEINFYFQKIKKDKTHICFVAITFLLIKLNFGNNFSFNF